MRRDENLGCRCLLTKELPQNGNIPPSPIFQQAQPHLEPQSTSPNGPRGELRRAFRFAPQSYWVKKLTAPKRRWSPSIAENYFASQSQCYEGSHLSENIIFAILSPQGSRITRLEGTVVALNSCNNRLSGSRLIIGSFTALPLPGITDKSTLHQHSRATGCRQHRKLSNPSTPIHNFQLLNKL